MKTKALAAIMAIVACIALNATIVTLLILGHIGDVAFSTCFLAVIGASILIYKIDDVIEFAVGNTFSAKLERAEKLSDAVKELGRELADVCDYIHKNALFARGSPSSKIEETIEKIKSLTGQ